MEETCKNKVMIFCLLVVVGLFFFEEPGWTQDLPHTVRRLIAQANPNAKIEYCGAISMKALAYYLFAVTHEEVAGVVLVRNGRENQPTIVDADTSLFSHRDPNVSSLSEPVKAAIGQTAGKEKRQEEDAIASRTNLAFARSEFNRRWHRPDHLAH